MLMPKTPSHNPLLYLAPYPDESISHYLGRWFRKDTVCISNSFSLSRKLRLGKTLYRWERFYFNPPPDQEELEKMSNLMGVEIDRLRAMFPLPGEPIKPTPIRMCAVCYAVTPYHRLSWQFQSTGGCDTHQLRLLSRCPTCGSGFPLPCDWVQDRCLRCGMRFTAMAKRQRAY